MYNIPVNATDEKIKKEVKFIKNNIWKNYFDRMF